MKFGQGEHRYIPYIRGLSVVVIILMQASWAAPECYADSGLSNMARGKTTYTTSATVPGSFTVDGYRGEYGSTCMDTNIQENPWLVVDLDETVPISTVVLTALTSYLATALYQVLVGNTFDATTFDPLTSGYEPCISRPVSMVEFEVRYVHCEKTLAGQYLLIFKQENASSLRICEVEVYAEQVFQTEKFTCIRPELQGPTGLLNLALGQNATQHTTSYDGPAYKAVDGNDDPNSHTGKSCIHNDPGVDGGYSWWMVDLGNTSAVTGVAITNRNDNGLGHHLTNFKLWVGNISGPSTPFSESDYQVVVDMCVKQARRRKYYKVDPPVIGNHVAMTLTGYHMICEVEVYSKELNDVTLSSWTNGIRLPQELMLYDGNETTYISVSIYPSVGRNPIVIEIPWNSTARTGVAERTSTYYCKQHFYVNVTHAVGIELSVSVSNEQVDQTAADEWTYQGKYCDGIGTMEQEGLTRVKYLCFCESKCWALVHAKLGMNVANSKLYTINVYD